jgi:hypothetical protein
MKQRLPVGHEANSIDLEYLIISHKYKSQKMNLFHCTA